MENTQKPTASQYTKAVLNGEELQADQALDLQTLEIALWTYLAQNKQVKIKGVPNFYVITFKNVKPAFCFSKTQSMNIRRNELWFRTYPFDDFIKALSYYKDVYRFTGNINHEEGKLSVAKIIQEFLVDKTLALW